MQANFRAIGYVAVAPARESPSNCTAAGYPPEQVVQPGPLIDELTCPICHNLCDRSAAVETACKHVFCNACISTYWNSSQHHRCPSCNATCLAANQRVEEANKTLFRLMGRIVLKCTHHERSCPWQGDMSELKSHLATCSKIPRQCKECGELVGCSDANKQAHVVACLRTQLRQKDAMMKVKDATHQAQVESLEQEVIELTQRARLTAASAAVGLVRLKADYSYTHDEVQSLGKYLSQNINCDLAPAVDVNRLFNCVCRLGGMYRAAITGETMEPYFGFMLNCYYMLSTALACHWFTNNQHSRIHQLLQPGGSIPRTWCNCEMTHA